VALVLLILWGVVSSYQYVTFFRNYPPFLLLPVGILLPLFGYIEYTMLIPIGFGLGILWFFFRHIRWVEY
jgi:hypothetical protein